MTDVDTTAKRTRSEGTGSFSESAEALVSPKRQKTSDATSSDVPGFTSVPVCDLTATSQLHDQLVSADDVPCVLATA